MSKRVKFELRSEMRRVLQSLDPRWIEAASHQLSDNLTQLLESLPTPPEHLLAWVSFFPGEVDLSAFINKQLDQRRVYLPQIRGERGMNFISIGKEWITSMEQGNFGIPEPSALSGEAYDTANAASTVVLVPGLAFARSGARLGRGKGFYDTFLARSSMIEATTIGLGWSLQLLPRVPADSHDIGMDFLCTEEGSFPSGSNSPE